VFADASLIKKKTSTAPSHEDKLMVTGNPINCSPQTRSNGIVTITAAPDTRRSSTVGKELFSTLPMLSDLSIDVNFFISYPKLSHGS
jgi:hypothetical protein